MLEAVVPKTVDVQKTILEPNLPHKPDFVGGILSYLVPGLGQISQGRVSKGLLFLISLHVLFFYGMWLGHGKNVYLPHTVLEGGFTNRLAKDLYTRPHFLGQFFIGIAAWPALIQYHHFDAQQKQGPWFGNFQREPPQEEINRLQRNNNKMWDLGWVYTVIAGILNLLVIYDAIAGPAFRAVTEKKETPTLPQQATV